MNILSEAVILKNKTFIHENLKIIINMFADMTGCGNKTLISNMFHKPG